MCFVVMPLSIIVLMYAMWVLVRYNLKKDAEIVEDGK